MANTLTRLLYDRVGNFKLAILLSPLFLLGLVAKLYAGTFFASQYFSTLFIPFLKYFTQSGFQNPYQYFFTLDILNAFPYPAFMLHLMALPGHILPFLLSSNTFSVTHAELLIYHLPILCADIIILVVLSRWLKNRENELLIFYWLSPILFYINYLHSQLDVIPIMLVFVFLYFLFKERWILSYIFLGLAITAKFHISILIPFTLIYLWRKQHSFAHLIVASGILAGVFLIINNIYLFSPAFLELVFNNKEQFKIFDLQMQIGGAGVLYLIPLAYIAVVLHSLTFRFFNRDTFVMFLGFSFGIFTLFIPPMPGWYYWIIPFFVYFYVKYADFSKFNFYFLNIAYFAYFFFIPQSDFFSIFQYVHSGIASLPTAYAHIENLGIDASMVRNIALTTLQAALLLNIVWIYRRGLEESKKRKLYNTPYLIGIAGDSGSGKSTCASLLNDAFGNHEIAVIEGDDLHKWERGHAMWQRMTPLNPKANELHRNFEHALDLLQGNNVLRRRYDHKSGLFTLPRKLHAKKILVFEGLHSFYLSRMRGALDLKVFIKPDEQLRRAWKVERDMNERGYNEARVLEQLAHREGDAENFIRVQERYADIIVSLKRVSSVLGGTSEVLHLTCDNTLNVMPLVDALTPFLQIDHTYDDEKQTFAFQGAIRAVDIEKVAYTLIPELYEIVITDSQWSPNYKGVLQLFLCFYILKTLPYKNERPS